MKYEPFSICDCRKPENRTIHWGFDSSSHWRSYLYIPDDQADMEALKKILDELRDRYEGKTPFPPTVVIESTVKRKQVGFIFLIRLVNLFAFEVWIGRRRLTST